MDVDDFIPEIIYPYDPRINPEPIPDTDVCDPPFIHICVNAKWWSHLSGVIHRLAYRDAWVGTDDEKHDAIESIYKIMNVGKPTMSCGCNDEPNRSRYTEDGDYEVSYDGGVTWQNGNDFDPRYTSPQYPPLSGEDGNDKKCAAANSIVAEMELKVAAWEDLLELGTGFMEFALAAIAALAVGIFAPAAVPFIFGACLAILKALWGVQVEDYHDAFTNTVFDDLLCIIYCHANSDGTFTQAQANEIIGDIASQFAGNSIVIDAFTLAVRGWGGVGLSNAAVINNGTRSCDDCDCFDSCAENWVIRPDLVDFCTITDVGEDFIECTAHTPLSNGVYYVNVQSAGGQTDCCYFDHYEIISGTVSGIAGTDCNQNLAPVGGIWTGHCVWILEPQSNAPFVIKLFLTPCP